MFERGGIRGESFKKKLWGWVLPWLKDFVEVGLTVAVVIVVLRVLLGADMLVPLVVVTSGSMTHNPGDDSWVAWMTSRNIGSDEISDFPFQSGFERGDMIIVQNPKSELGDVVIYERDLDHRSFFGNDPIIHRAVGVIYVQDWKPAKATGTLDCITGETLAQTISVIKNCQIGGGCPYPNVPKTGTFKLYVTKGYNNEGSDQCSPRLKLAYLVNEAQITGRGWLRLPYIGYVKLFMNFILDIILLPFRLIFGF